MIGVYDKLFPPAIPNSVRCIYGRVRCVFYGLNDFLK